MHDRALRGAIYALTGHLFGSGGLQNMAISGTKFGYYGGLTGTRPENLFWSHTTFHNQTRIRDIFDFSRPAVTAHRNAKSVKSPSLRTDTVGSSLLLEKAEIALFCTLDCRTVSPLLQTAEGLVSGIFEFTTSNLGGRGVIFLAWVPHCHKVLFVIYHQVALVTSLESLSSSFCKVFTTVSKWVPIGTFLAFWVPIYFSGSLFSVFWL